MISEPVKKRLRKNRPMTSITIRMPVDIVEDLKAMAPKLGFSGYQPLLRSYISAGMRRDEAALYFTPENRIAEALKARGIDPDIVDSAVNEIREQDDTTTLTRRS